MNTICIATAVNFFFTVLYDILFDFYNVHNVHLRFIFFLLFG